MSITSKAPAAVAMVDTRSINEGPEASSIMPPRTLASTAETVVVTVYTACPFTASPFAMTWFIKETIAGRNSPKEKV